MKEINKGDTLYAARIIPTIPIYEVQEIKIRTVTKTYFVGCEKTEKQAFLYPMSALGRTVFWDRKECLEIVNDAEEMYRKDKE